MYSTSGPWPSQILDAVPVPVLVFDPERRLLGLNVAAADLLGVQPDPLPANPEVVSGLLSPEVRESLDRLHERGDGVTSVRAELSGRGVSYTASWVRAGADSPDLVVLSILPGPGEEARHLSIAAHELKTPLTSIKGSIQLLQRRLSRGGGIVGDREARLLDLVLQQVDRLAEIVDGLLESSRLEEGRVEVAPERLDLREVVRSAVDAFERGTPSPRVRLTTVQERVMVRCDPRRIAQVMHSLLSNAARHAPEGEEVEVGVGTSGDEAVVSVADNGPGIPPEHHSRVFERFFRGAGDGLGVGLYIARGLVRLQGGRMWFESREGHGTTFYFSLPLA